MAIGKLAFWVKSIPEEREQENRSRLTTPRSNSALETIKEYDDDSSL